MDIIASDALKNTKWGHMVKTKIKGFVCYSYHITHEIKFTHQPNLSLRNDILLNHLNFPRSKHTLTLQQISLA